MTFEQLKEKGIKKLFLKEDTESCKKGDLIAWFNLINKGLNNFIYKTEIEIKIYYYSATQCFINIDCEKKAHRKNIYFTIQEIVEYDEFFNHIFDIDEYVK